MQREFQRDLAAMDLPVGPALGEPLLERDLAELPTPARRMMRFARVLGRPRDWSFNARLSGRFRPGRDAAWQHLSALQYSTGLPEPTRIFYMTLRFFGLPVLGRDTYLHGKGRMLVRPLDLFTVQDGQGPEFDLGELVTWLNDAVLLAPSMLLHPAVSWTGIDDHCFELTVRDQGKLVRARVYVDAQGGVTDFHTEDRWFVPPGSKEAPVRTLWTTPVEGWHWVDGRMLPTRAEAIWRPEGSPPLPYASIRFEPGMLLFNVPPSAPLAAAA